MESAQDTALATVEVLENILLSLDLQSTLTSAQRVCHSWHDLVSTSPSLQKHLYFQPDWQRRHKHRNPLLAKLFPGWFPSAEPQLERVIEHGIIESGYLGSESDFENLTLAQPDKNASFMWKNASWRRMLVQQPPILDLAIFRVKSARGGKSMRGPYIQEMLQADISVEDLYSQSLAAPNPLRMDLFFDQVIHTNGAIPTCWMTMWYNGDREAQVPSAIGSYKFKEEGKRMLRETVELYEMGLVVYQTQQCKRPFHWTPGKKFIFSTDMLDLNDGYI